MHQVETDGVALKEESVLKEEEILAELLMMGLRLEEGIDLEEVHREHGLDVSCGLDLAQVAVMEQRGLLCRPGSRIRATEAGRKVLNSLIERVLR